MSQLDEIERALRSSWTLDALAAYADALQLHGDPRGELVALDLRPAPRDVSWRKRRRELTLAWLGDLANTTGHLVQHGFVHELRDGAYPFDLLDGKLGTYVRGYSTWGRAMRVTAALERLARRERPWLQRLTIAYWGDAPLPDALAARVIAAAPNLRELRLVGRPVFAHLEHAALRHVVAEPRAAIAGLAAADIPVLASVGAPAAAVTREELELLLDAIDLTPDINALHAAYEHAFAEPLELLLARAEVAGLVDVDGPIVSRAVVVYPPEGGRSSIRPDWAGGELFGTFLQVPGQLGPRAAGMEVDARQHFALVDACHARLPLTDACRAEVRAHVRMFVDPWPGQRIYTLDSVDRQARALYAILELRGFDIADLPQDPAAWHGLEDVCAILMAPTARQGITFALRRPSRYD